MNVPRLGQTILYRDPMLYGGQVVAIVIGVHEDGGFDLDTFPRSPPGAVLLRVAVRLDDSNWEPV